MPQSKTVPELSASEDPDAQSFVGKKIACPGEVFDSPGRVYRGVVTGTPKTRGRGRTRCYVRFEGEDTTEYWFPSKDVAGWLEDKTGLESNAMASLQGSLTPELSDVSVEYTRPSAIEPPNTSEFETSDAVPTTDNEEKYIISDQGASRGAVQQGAEYGIPISLTLAVLVLSGLLWFFAQLWVSEKRLSHSSIPSSA